MTRVTAPECPSGLLSGRNRQFQACQFGIDDFGEFIERLRAGQEMSIDEEPRRPGNAEGFRLGFVCLDELMSFQCAQCLLELAHVEVQIARVLD